MLWGIARVAESQFIRLSNFVFTRPTTIIVGAGASVEFGLPSGKDVFLNLVSECNKYIKNRDQNSKSPSDFQKLLNQQENSPDMRRLMEQMAHNIEFQPVTSIDEYLFNNPRFYQIGKLYSLLNISTYMYETEKIGEFTNVYRRKPAFKKNLLQDGSNTPSWLATLAAQIMSDCKDIEDLRNNKLNILTFNYDTNIEDGLLSLLSNTERFSDIESLDFINIYHINGQFNLNDRYDLVRASHYRSQFLIHHKFYDDISNSLTSFYMIKEKIDVSLQMIRSEAATAIEDSDRIYSIGFACDSTNCELIGLQNLEVMLPMAKFYALNYDGDLQLSRRLSDLGAQKPLIDGTPQNPLGCSAAAAKGFFEQ